MCRKPGTLGTEGVLDHLNQSLLPLAQEVGNIRVRGVGLDRIAFLGEEDIGEIVEDSPGFANVEKGIAMEADIDERRLHTR